MICSYCTMDQHDPQHSEDPEKFPPLHDPATVLEGTFSMRSDKIVQSYAPVLLTAGDNDVLDTPDLTILEHNLDPTGMVMLVG